MKPFLFILALCLLPSWLFSQEKEPLSSDSLQKNTLWLQSQSYLNLSLPELAIQKLDAIAERFSLDEPAQTSWDFSMAKSLCLEALLQEKNASLLAHKALELLNKEPLLSSPKAFPWRIRCLLISGQYAALMTAIEQLPENFDQRERYLLLSLRLAQALGNTTFITKYLPDLLTAKDSEVSKEATLIQARNLLEEKKVKQAQQLLLSLKKDLPNRQALIDYLLARCAQENEDYATVQHLLLPLLEKDKKLPSSLLQEANICLAKSLIQEGKEKQKAIDLLSHFIRKYPNAALIPEAFDLLFSPHSPLSPPKETTLDAWISQAMPMSRAKLYALFTKALLSLPPHPSSQGDMLLSQSLFAYLRASFPHKKLSLERDWQQLSARSLFALSQASLQRGNMPMALFCLSLLDDPLFPENDQTKALYQKALILVKNGKKEEAYTIFSQLQQHMGKDALQEASAFNTALLALQLNETKAFKQSLQSLHNEALQTTLLLQKALYSSYQKQPQSRKALQTFLENFPEHPQSKEALFALIDNAINLPPFDTHLALASLDKLTLLPLSLEEKNRSLHLHIATLSLQQRWTDAQMLIKDFVKNNPTTHDKPLLSYLWSQCAYHNADFVSAQQGFQKTFQEAPQAPIAPYAIFYAALSALHSGTPQALNESCTLLQQVTEMDTPLALHARLTRGQILLKKHDYQESFDTLAPLLTTPLAIDAGIIQISALQGLKHMTKALELCQHLLSLPDITSSQNNHICYLRGILYIQNNEPILALASYLQPLENTQQPDEWLWFERCGFQAIALLERENRPHAAYDLAQRLAKLNGPRHQEASLKSKQLIAKYMLWQREEPNKAQVIEP